MGELDSENPTSVTIVYVAETAQQKYCVWRVNGLIVFEGWIPHVDRWCLGRSRSGR